VKVDKLPAHALLDTGATESYIHEELVKKLKLKSQGELSLASVGTSAQVRGFVLVPVKAFSRWYELKMGVGRELCADLILGQDFLKWHKSATFLMGGLLKAIEVNQCNTCGVAAANHRVCSSFSGVYASQSSRTPFMLDCLYSTRHQRSLILQLKITLNVEWFIPLFQHAA